MQIFINDIPCECPANTTISEILSQQGIKPVNLAIAIENTVIPKTQWDTTIVQENCNLLIIKAVQGG